MGKYKMKGGREMIQEEKQLLLKDLCGRLPYEVKIKCNDDDEPYTLLSINWNKEIVIIGFEIDGIYVTSKQKLADIKPCLRPMSSMTEEEIEELKNLSSGVVWRKDVLHDIVLNIWYNTDSIDWLNANHFDYRGLIEKGLAIEVTKDNNPYK